MHFLGGVPGEDLDREKSVLSGDTQLSDLINDELPDPMSFYYNRVKYTGGISCDVLEFIDIAEERDRRRKCLSLSFTTGLTPDEYSRYNG